MPDTTTTYVDIATLVDWVRGGVVVLPEFQRNFAWSDEHVSSLLVSLVKGWPAGTFLFTEIGTASTYALRPFEGGPPVDSIMARYLVLDGQQRITGLYEAMNSAGERIWALNLSDYGPELGPDDLQGCIQVFSRRQWSAVSARARRGQGELWMPFHVLRSESAFFRWREEVATSESFPIADALTEVDLRSMLARRYKDGLDRVPRYRFPVVLIDRSVDPESVALIFERLNTSGLALSTFDLVVAHTYSEKWNLRHEWDLALAGSQDLREFFDQDGLAPVEVITLVQARSVRRNDVLQRPPHDIRANFQRAIESLEAAIAMCRSWGVLRPEFLPHRAFLIVLGAVAYAQSPSPTEMLILRSWFFSRAFVQRFNVAVNTSVASEYGELVDSLRRGVPIRQLVTTAAQIVTANARTSSGLYRAFLALLASERVFDAPVGLFDVPLEGDALRPAALMRFPYHRRVLGYALLSRSSSRLLEGRGAAGLLSALRGSGEGSFESMSWQLLPADEGAYRDDEAFLRARLSLVRRRLNELAGYEVIEDAG